MAQVKLTADILNAALEGYKAQKVLLDSRIAEVRRMLDGGAEAKAPTGIAKPRKKFSAATRRKMAAAQRARYSKLKQGSEPTQTATAKPKRKMSAAGRKNIIAATKRRWAAVRAAKKAV